jgi:multiple sugar transport system substrate-binding protein
MWNVTERAPQGRRDSTSSPATPPPTATGRPAGGAHRLTRRRLAATAASLMGTLSACRPEDRASGRAAPPPAREDVVLRLSAWGTAEEAETWQSIAGEFTASQPHIKVDFEHIPVGYEGRIFSMHVAGDAPNVMSIQDEPFPEFTSKGIYQDLTPLVERDASRLRLADVWPHWIDAFRWDKDAQRTNVPAGRIYGLPWDGASVAWYYNKDAFDRAGVRYPTGSWTWEEFIDSCLKLSLRDTEGTPVQLAYDWPGSLSSMPWVWTLGQEYLYLDKEYRACELHKPGSQFAHEQMWRLAHDWRVVRLSTDYEGERSLFENGRVAMMFIGAWPLPGLRRWKAEKGWDNWDLAHMWTFNGKRQSRQTPDAVTNWSLTKYPDQGWSLMQHIVGESAQRRVAELGRGIPARISVARSAAFARPDTAQREEVFLDAMAYSGYQPVTKYWGDMWKIIDTYYRDMMSATIKRRPSTFLEQMSRDITSLLRTGVLPSGYA